MNPRSSVLTVLVCAGLMLPGNQVLGQTCVDGICFVDHGAAGTIDFGFLRGGTAVIDYDNDGFPDLVICDRRTQPQRLFHNEADPETGERTFVDVTDGSGLADDDGTARNGRGAVAADYDNDGDTDVFILGYQPDDVTGGILYRNEGDGTFTNTSIPAGVRFDGDIPDSASWNDYDLDGFVDLFIANQGESLRPLRLFHNQGDGTFSDATNLLPVVEGVNKIYAHTWSDYDADGYADCFLLTLGRPPVLLKNVDDGGGGRAFIDAGPDAGFTFLGPAPMGVSAADFDNDGDFDIALSNGNVGVYYENTGGSFLQITPMTSIWAWGAVWLDVDNDGDLDHYQAGSLGQGSNHNKLFRNLGGGLFDDISDALNDDDVTSQQAVRIDYNNDGRQDLLTVHPGDPGQYISLIENTSETTGHWITLHLRGDGAQANRDAIGAVVRVTAGGLTQSREISSGSSTRSSEDLRAHFGLAQTAVVDEIVVIWPRTGTIESRTETFAGPIPVDRIVTVTPDGSVPIVAELVDFEIAFGSHLKGGIEQLLDSDDDYLRARSKRGFTAFEPNVADLVLGAMTTVENAAMLDLLIESRVNNPGGVARLRFRNWDTNGFEQVAQYAVLQVDATETIESIDATDFVRADDGRIELASKHVVIAVFSAIGFDSFYDRVQVVVN